MNKAAGRYGVAVWGLLLLTAALPTAAWGEPWRFQRGELNGGASVRWSLSGAVRMQDRHTALIGKSNLDPSLCAAPGEDDCLAITEAVTEAQRAFNRAPGAFTVQGDDGNLNYDKHDPVAGALKADLDFAVAWRQFRLVSRSFARLDAINHNFEQSHPNTRFQPANSERPAALDRIVGNSFQLQENYLEYGFNFGFLGRGFVRAGLLSLEWGPSVTDFVGGVGSINPIDINRLFLPGFTPGQFRRPIPAVQLDLALDRLWRAEFFYQWKFEPIVTAVPGSFFSLSDTGIPGGSYATGLNGKVPEDPQRQQRPSNPVLARLTDTSFTGLRRPDRSRSSPQYGLALHWTWDRLYHDVEFGFYAANYHHRRGIVSLNAAQASCGRDARDNAELARDCSGFAPQSGERGDDPLPVDTANYFFEFPPNVQLFGGSVSTAIGNWGVEAELAYRPNLPLQIDLEDVTYAALEPAFPKQDIDIGGLQIGAFTVPPATRLPSGRTAADNFYLDYFGIDHLQPGQYLPGYLRRPVADLSVSGSYGVGADFWGFNRFWGLLELTARQIFNMPGRDQLPLDGPGTFTSAKPGTIDNPDGSENGLRQNPRPQQDGFGTDFAWGYRALLGARWSSSPLQAVVDNTVFIAHDLGGVAPGPQSHLREGRIIVRAATALRWRRFTLEPSYVWFTGAGPYNLYRDRDYAALELSFSLP